MSSPPPCRTLEGLVVETWGREALDRADVMQFLEPHRRDIERLMDDFDEDTQSWRDYSACIWGGWGGSEGAIPRAVWRQIDELMRAPPSPPALCEARGPGGPYRTAPTPGEGS
jgi:hypothetical protein